MASQKLASVQDLYGPLSTKSCLKRKPNEEDRQWLRNELSDEPFIGLHLQLSDSTPDDDVRFGPTFNALINCEKFFNAHNKVEHVLSNLKLTSGQSDNIFAMTVGQRGNWLWEAYRVGRLMSNSFGIILKALEKQNISPSLINSLKDDCFDKVIPPWSAITKKMALSLFSEIMDLPVKQCGVYLHKSGALGCSPDGLTDDSIVEIKCPYSNDSESDLLNELRSGTWYMMPRETTTNSVSYSRDGKVVHVFNEDDLVFNLKHRQGINYHHQVQGSLHLLNKDKCNFILSTPVTTLIVPIRKDPCWRRNIDILLDFYRNIFIFSMLKEFTS
ncbi:uncharacterized protein LOC129224588 [Uloborus diversus]|uniref:uncharacterized protein LOC129224588 n=1 Tax=Uloborus diversus TaxID=327109 RepID=UPI0024092480|nr:uncharacterized protein LOC129224588 [Uloborus diversus]